LRAFIAILQREGVRSYLEIGARHGDTFYEVMRALPRGAKGLAVDMPGGNWGSDTSRPALIACCVELEAQGYDTAALFGDSRCAATASIIARHGQWDAVFIDGDHLYESVKSDWLIYGNRARIVAFHDIAGVGQTSKQGALPVEVPRLWHEIKGGFRHVELIAEHSRMGIGVLWVHQ